MNLSRRQFLGLVGTSAAAALLAQPRSAAAGTEELWLPRDWATTAEDVAAVEDRLRLGRRLGWDARPLPALFAAFGETFLGTPYLAHSLDDTGAERLMFNLRGLDCVTFLETSLALARTLRAGHLSVRAFGRQLETLRYRGGRRGNYLTRLHYFEDWLEDNAARGNVRLLTPELGGEPLVKTIDFMSTHRDLYPVLAHDDAAVAAIQATEAALMARPRTYIPKARVAAVADRLQTGDVLGITTATDGLLVSHTAMAYRNPDGALHLLHAPNVGYDVQVTGRPLADYLASIPKDTGVMIARPL